MKIINCIIVLLVLCNSSFGQDAVNHDKMTEKVNAHKVAFISEKIGLTDTESKKFWPVYNNYQAEKDLLKKNIQIPVSADISDKEADNYLSKWSEYRTKEVEIQKKFISKLRSVVPPRKIVLLFQAERAFKEEILSKVKDKCRISKD
ncbi:MAG: hypothetical protein IPM42_11510 [Saprospiraceae bacterium]|nr:hypothetical protein [Saprospiraceae bacterium]